MICERVCERDIERDEFSRCQPVEYEGRAPRDSVVLGCREPDGERRKQIVQAIAMGEHMMATVSPKRLLVVPGRLVCAEVEVDGPGFLDDLQPQPHLHITMTLDNGCPAKLAGRFLMGFKEQWEVIEGTRLSDIEALDFSDNVRLSDCRVKSYFR
ncbi:hypothetical protein FOZ60_009768 [Perkinsus olseni]|uniref:Uncharacterized protein n=1 Tax=Perkinsus olseni TaxID=32597 RepID=A0A7J6NHQ2_PEROL|nr:hypothetical protein FOZ60_009768 [Perkinsus olseni]